MKKFIVDTGDKKYKVEANTYDEAISVVKTILLKDEASPLQTVNALLEDERAAVDAYNVALENLKGKIPDESYAAIEAIRNDENRHIENLQAVVNGNVTEKNLEDSIKDNFYAIRTRNNGRVGEWYVKANSEHKAFDVVKRQPGHQFDEFVSIKQVNENALKRVGARILEDAVKNNLDVYRSAIKEAVDELQKINGKYNEQDKVLVQSVLQKATAAIARAKSNYEKWM